MSNKRVWIFPSSEIIEQDVQVKISEKLNEFLASWQAHGNDLNSEHKFIDNHFLKVLVDENFAQATGCSIDSMVKFIQKVEAEFGLELMNRMRIFAQSNGEVIHFKPNEIKQNLNRNSLEFIYNTSVSSESEFNETWKLSPQESPLTKRFFDRVS